MGETESRWGETAEEELSDLQKEILRTSWENPDMSMSEIADEVGASESWTRQTINEYKDGMKVVEDSSSSGGSGLASLIMFPFKLAGAMLKLALWLVALPFKILAKIFG